MKQLLFTKSNGVSLSLFTENACGNKQCKENHTTAYFTDMLINAHASLNLPLCDSVQQQVINSRF